MKNVVEAAEAKGWNTLSAIPLRPGEVLAMNWVGGHHPYAVHNFSEHDGGFYHGSYHSTPFEAENAFVARMNRRSCTGCSN